jgi:hypothetical protein
MVTNVGDGTSGYGNLPLVLLVFQSTTWWLDSDANVHVCSNAFLFSSYQAVHDSFMMIGNESHAYIYGVDTVDLKLTSRKIIQLKTCIMSFLSTKIKLATPFIYGWFSGSA